MTLSDTLLQFFLMLLLIFLGLSFIKEVLMKEAKNYVCCVCSVYILVLPTTKIRAPEAIACDMGLPNLPGADGRGLLVAGVGVLFAIAASLYFKKKPKGCLDPEKFKEFKLINRTQLSHNTDKFRFALPTPTSVLGLPIGHFIRCKGRNSQGEEVVRPYTPITLDSDVGYFELVVKMYPKGKMSHHFREMRVGQYLLAKGPIGRFKYKPGQSRAIGMLAGGSGITPMFQLARGILENPKDKTSLHLIYANSTFGDILLKPELDTLVTKFPNRFTVYYVLSQPPKPWNGGSGHISKEMIRDHCPAPANDIQILRCGPPEMNKAMAAHLNDLGYTSEMQFQF